MKAPDDETREKLLDALIESGLGFVERSVGELRNDPFLSVAHFATGLELLLKARLFAVHWSLIAQRPHSCTWASLRRGEVQTVQASDLCDTLTTLTGTPLGDQKDTFGAVFRHRNRVLHWLPEIDEKAVAAEQCRAWHALHQLLVGPWKTTYVRHGNRVRAVDRSLLKHREYLAVRFEAVEPTLEGARRSGGVHACPSCGFVAAVLREPAHPVADYDCRVCEDRGHMARFACGARVCLTELPVDCLCGGEHTTEELAEQIEPSKPLSPKEWLSVTPNPLCSECQGAEPVVAYAEEYLCLGCGERCEFGESSSCESCGTCWIGYDTEHSAVLGCPQCR